MKKPSNTEKSITGEPSNKRGTSKSRRVGPKQTPDMIAESQRASEYFRRLVDATPDAILVVDPAGMIVLVNLQTEKLFGYSRDEILGRSMDSLIPERFRSRHGLHRLHYFDKPLARQMGAGLELFGLAKDGAEFPVDISLSPFQTEEGLLVMAAIRDVTERKLAQDALQRARDYSENVIQTANIMFMQVDISGNIRDFNSAAEEVTGYGRNEVLGRNWAEALIPRERQAYAWEEFYRVIDKGEDPGSYERPIITKSGKKRNVLWNHNVLREAGKVAGIISFGIDVTGQKLAEEKIQRQLAYLSALREIDRVIASSFDLQYNLTWILDYVIKELAVDAADVLILNPVSSRLEYGSGAGFYAKTLQKALTGSGQSHAMRAILDRQVVYIPDLKDQPNDLLSIKVMAGDGFVSYYGVPLIAKGIARGVLEVYHRTRLEPDQEWLDFLNSLASQTALAIDNANLFDSLQRSNMDLTLAYDATIEGWSRAMDLRDKETEGHTQRVTEMTMKLAGLFGINERELLGIRRGALLHDIGKMGVPDGVLLKPDKLTEEEWIIMKTHPALAYEMLSPIQYLQSAMDIPYCHHEKWDGTGYPRGLKGEQIPLSARIFSIVDVWDALTSDRPYREAWPKQKTFEYLKSESGKHFDPQVLKTCLESGVFDH